MDFLTHVLVTPTTPEMFSDVRKRVPSELIDPQGRLMLEEEIDSITTDAETRFVLREVNARKPIHVMYDGPQHMAREELNGWIVNTKRGQLGLHLAGVSPRGDIEKHVTG